VLHDLVFVCLVTTALVSRILCKYNEILDSCLCRALGLETGKRRLELHQSRMEPVVREDMVSLNCTTRRTSSNRGRQVTDMFTFRHSLECIMQV